MLSVDHSNIDGPPLAVKCVRKFGSALGGKVTHMSVCVCVHYMRQVDFVYVLYVRRAYRRQRVDAPDVCFWF